jgi:hypothetical protein
MDVLVAVERQLGGVNYERDHMRGRLNQLYAVCAEPYVTIYVSSNPPEPVILPVQSFSEQLEKRFVRSLNTFIRFMENAAIWFSGAFVPLAISGIIIGIIVAIVRKVRGKSRED